MSLSLGIAVEIGIDDCSPLEKLSVGASDDPSDEEITLSRTVGANSDEKTFGRPYTDSVQSS